MKRSSAFAVLVTSLALIGATLLATLGAIGAGAWQPLGERPAPTPRPESTDQPGGPVGGQDWDAFLADVQSGNVLHVDYEGGEVLFVETRDGAYPVGVPADVGDPFPVIVAAAEGGGVPPPSYTVDGQTKELGEQPYSRMLEDVEAGQLVDVSQSGVFLTCSGRAFFYTVTLDDPGTDVLGDIEAAAAAGGVMPPSYSKYPESKFPEG